MQIKAVGKTCNMPNSATFKGRLNMPGEKFYAKMIDNMGFYEKQAAEEKLFATEQETMPKVKQSFIGLIKEIFFQNPADLQAPLPTKTLLDYWKESINTMKTLVIEKLPGDYVLRCRKSNLGPGSMSFSLTKGRDHIYGASANIKDPKFPERHIKQAVDIISDPLFKRKFADLQEIIPNLTEDNYVMHHEKFSRPNILAWVDTNNKLKQEAAAKKLELSIKFSAEHHFHQAEGVIKNQQGEVIHKSHHYFSSFEEVAQDLAERLKSL